MTTLYVQRIYADDLADYVTYQTEIPTTAPTETTPVSIGPYDVGTHEILQRVESLHLKVFPPVATAVDLPTGVLIDVGTQCWVIDEDAMYYASVAGGSAWDLAAGGGGGGPLAGDVVGALATTTVQRLQGVNFPVGPYADGSVVSTAGGAFAVQVPGGDIDGAINVITVVGIQGVSVDAAAGTPSAGDLIVYDGAAYNVTNIEDLIISETPVVGGDLDGTLPNPMVVGFATVPIETTSPDQGNFFQFDVFTSQWALRPSPYVDVTLSTNEIVTVDQADVEIVVGGTRVRVEESNLYSFYSSGFVDPDASGSLQVRLYIIPALDVDPYVLLSTVTLTDDRYDYSLDPVDGLLEPYYNSDIDVEVRLFLTATEVDTSAHLYKAGLRIDFGARDATPVP